LADFNDRAGAQLPAADGLLLMHLGSTDVIRDMEAIRAALRDGKLNGLPLVRATMLGALYAERYPNRIRTMALDGALDRALSEPACWAPRRPPPRADSSAGRRGVRAATSARFAARTSVGCSRI